MKALDESIIIEVNAKRAGEEQVSSGGIVIGRLEVGEIPDIGLVISVGDEVPEKVLNELLGKTVLIPNGRIAHVVDPRVVKGEIVSKPRQLVTTHWKNIQVVY